MSSSTDFRLRRWVRMGLGLGLMAGAVSAFDPFTDNSGIYVLNWERGDIPMAVNLDASTTLSDGTTERSSVEAAMAAWNAVIGKSQFVATHGTEGSYELGNDRNEIVMDDSIGGLDFGGSTLAVALSYTDGNYHVESDVIFNRQWRWDSYRGDLRQGVEEDIRRVAIHELGHVLGLGHPDQADPPQDVDAIMNSVVSDIDTLQADDIAGGHFHYGAPNSPPPNDNFADAIEIVLAPDGTASIVGSSIQSTTETDEPVLDTDYPGGHSVWWKWTAPANRLARVTTMGSRFDTVLGVFTGDDVAGLTRIAANDDVDPGVVRTSTIDFLAEEAVTYYFMVDGWDGYEGPVQLNLTFPARAFPPELSVESVRVDGTIGVPLNLEIFAESRFFALEYQWHKDGREIAGETAAALSVGAFGNDNAGVYTVRVREVGGEAAYATFFVMPDYQTTQVLAVTSVNHRGDPATVPSGLNDAVQAVAADWASVVLHRDGTVSASQWGSGNLYSEAVASPPAGLANVVSLAAGRTHVLALKADGTVVAWGSNSFEQTDVPAGLNQVVGVAAGDYHSIALRADGSVRVWGNTVGSQAVARLNDLSEVAALRGDLGIKRDGTVSSLTGSLSVGIPLHGPVDDAVYDGNRIMTVNDAGFAKAWGTWPSELPDPENVSRLVAGHQSVGFITAGRDLVVGGSNIQVGVRQVPLITAVVDADIGSAHAVIVRDISASTVPTIVEEPGSTRVMAGDVLTLRSRAVAPGAMSVQWFRDGVELVNDDRVRGAQSPVLRVHGIQQEHAGNYHVVFRNSSGEQASAEATVTVQAGPEWRSHPLTQIVPIGDSVSLSAEAAGTGNVSYQWWFEGQALPGENNATLHLSAMTFEQGGLYAVSAMDDVGTIYAHFQLKAGLPTATVVYWRNGEAMDSRLPAETAGVLEVVPGEKGAALTVEGDVVAWGDWTDVSMLAAWTDIVDVALSPGDDIIAGLRSDGTVLVGGGGYIDLSAAANWTQVVEISFGDRDLLAVCSDGTVLTTGYGLPRPNREFVRTPASGTLMRADGFLQGGGWGDFLDTPRHAREVVNSYGGTLVLEPGGQVSAASTLLPEGLGLVKTLGMESAVLADGRGVLWTSFSGDDWPRPVNFDGAVSLGGDRLTGWAIVPADAPSVIEPPESLDAVADEAVEFTVSVSGHGPLAYQWFHDGVMLADSAWVRGSQTATLSIDPVRLQDAGEYTVRVRNVAGEVVSSPVSLSVEPVPQLPAAITSRSIRLGQAVRFDVGPLSDGTVVAWYHNGALVPGTSGTVFEIPTVGQSNAGYYEVRLTAANGRETRNFFRLDVVAADAVPLIWGQNTDGLMDVPDGLTGVVQVALGESHVVVLTHDGKVFAWGDNSLGQTTVPVSLGPVTRIAAGSQFSVALQADGTVVAWGRNVEGQSDVPDIARRAVDVFATETSAVALLDNGETVTWGESLGGNDDPVDDEPLVDIAMASSVVYGLTANGTVVGWGHGSGLSNPGRFDGATKITAAGNLLAGLLPDGVWTYERPYVNGAFGGTPPNVSGVVELATGATHLLLRRDTGSVLGWGDNSEGQILIPSGITNASAIYAGADASAALVPASGLRFSVQPNRRGIQAGESAEFSVAVSGAVGEPTYQWYLDGSPVADGAVYSGARTATLQVNNTAAVHAGKYSVRVSDSSGSVESFAVRLEVSASGEAPVFTQRPLSRYVTAGQAVTLSARAEGAVSYWWRRDGYPIFSGSDGDLSLASPGFSDSGFYTVEAVSADGVASFSVFHLKVTPSDPELRVFTSIPPLPAAWPETLTGIREVLVHGFDRAIIYGDGQVDLLAPDDPDLKTAVESLTGVVKLESAYDGAIALHADGSLSWPGGALSVQALVDELDDDVVDFAILGTSLRVLHADGTITVVDASPSLPEIQASRLSERVLQLVRDMGLNSRGEVFSLNLQRAEQVIRYVPGPARKIVDYLGLVQLRDGTLHGWSYSVSSDVPDTWWGEVFRDAALGSVIRQNWTVGVYDGQIRPEPSGVESLVGVWQAAHRLRVDYALIERAGPSVGVVSGPAADYGLGDSLELEVSVTGSPPFVFEWRFNGAPLSDDHLIDGSETSRLRISDLAASHFGRYSVVVGDQDGAVEVDLGVVEPDGPIILQQPFDRIVDGSHEAELTVLAAGPSDLSYQWYAGEAGDTSFPMAGETEAVFTAPILTGDTNFWVRVTGGGNSLDSETARVVPLLPQALPLEEGEPGSLGVTDGYLYVERQGEMAVTTDATNWVHFPTQRTNSVLVHADGVFLRSGSERGEVVRSTNLTEWESHATGNPVSFTAIGYNGEVFVAAGRRLLRSVDGVNWTRVSSGAFQRVIWTGQYWIGVESFGQLSYSADGVDWFEPDFGVGYEVADVIHADGRVWALIDDNRDGYRVVSFAEDFTDRKVVELSGFGLSPPRGNFVVGARQLNIWTESRRFASFDGDNWEAQPYDGRSWYRVVRWGSRHAGLDTSGNFYLSSPAPSLSTLTVVDLAAPVASGEAVQLEVSGTTAGAMLQWFEGAVGDTSRPVVGATARVAEVVPVETTQYWARQSNGVSFIDSPAIAVEVFTVAPTIRETPVGGVGQVGDSFVMTVSAEGSPVLAYQWFKDNQAIGGETLASLSMSELILADAGRYHVVVSNAAGSVASAPVRLSVLPIGAQVVGTHEVVSTTVLPGQAVRIRNTIAFDEAVSSITWSVLLPAEWEYLNASGVTGNPSLVPQPGDHDLLEWNWDSLSGDSMQWEYELRFPASEPRGGALVGLVAVERASVQLEVLVSPDPLVVSATRHSADTDGDQRLSLSELLRVIELYNTRAGSSRTGRYRLAAGSADGFDPDSRGIGEGDTPSRFHSADMDRDGRLSLSELLRVIELYNTRSGSSRTGAYRINPDSADGFDPDN